MGNRRLLDRVFFQGKPASNPSLARTLAAVTGREVLVPPDPGAMGAIGIALLRPRGSRRRGRASRRATGVASRSTSAACSRRACVSRREGRCGDTACGNLCRIETAQIDVGDELRTIRSGGNCPVRGAGAGGRKLPREAPNPFREGARPGESAGPRAGLGAETRRASAASSEARWPAGRSSCRTTHYLIDLAPFFATFLTRLGRWRSRCRSPTHARWPLGDRLCGAVGACAPVKLAHGSPPRPRGRAGGDAGCDADLFLPRLVNVPYPAAGVRPQHLPAGAGCAGDGAGGARWSGVGQRAGRSCLDAAWDSTQRPLGRRTEAALVAPWRTSRLRPARGTPPAGRRGEPDGADGRPAPPSDATTRGRRDIGEEALAFARPRGLPGRGGARRDARDPRRRAQHRHPRPGRRPTGRSRCRSTATRCRHGIPDLPRVHWASAGAVAARGPRRPRRRRRVPAAASGRTAAVPTRSSSRSSATCWTGYPHAVFETDGHGGLAGYVTRVQAFLHAVEGYRAAGRRAVAGRSASG